MIKLQLLLRHPAQLPEIDPALRARIEALGLHVTGSGRASVSAEAQADVAARLFGQSFNAAAPAGFGLLAAPALPVPPGLADAVSAISIAPRHTTNSAD